MQLRQLTITALLTALLTLLAQISIPIPFTPVPVTGQTLGIFLSVLLLGKRQALLAILSYLLLGAAGVPVFASGRGGLPVLLGPTGGYLLGFLPGAYLGSRFLQGRTNPNIRHTITALFLCILFYYLPGTLQLSLVMRLSFSQAILAGTLPYLLPDLAKAALAATITPAIRTALINEDCLGYPSSKGRGFNHRGVH